MFTREDWKLFRNLDTLCQKAGVQKSKIPMLVIKELVDNAIDTKTEIDFGLLGEHGFFIQDEGEGIEPSRLKDFFSINRPMITTKLLRLPTKGALGNGLRVAMGSIVATGGKLFISTKGFRYEIIPQDIDGSSRVIKLEAYEGKGTKIEFYFGNSISISEKDFHWAKLARLFSIGNGEDFSCQTSPFWYNSESFFELVNSYSGDIKSLCLFFDKITPSKAKKIANQFKETLTKELTFEKSDDLLNELRKISKPINYKKLGYCGDMFNRLGEYVKVNNFIDNSTTKGLFDGRIPYLVEAWIEFSSQEKVEVLVNKTPITGDFRTWMSKGDLVISGCGLLHAFKTKPAKVFINIITPYMPITSDGKSPNLSEFIIDIKKVLDKANKKAKKAYALRNNENSKNMKEIIEHNLPEAINKASGYGKYIFSQRQLFYAIRPYVMTYLDKEPEYGYFCRILTEYENYHGEIEGLYRDARGTLYHPHTKEEIPLGTIAVRNYERPKWTFNKILYCEKEGFFPILKDAGIPEELDIALVSSKGYASRAVKDLFDLLGDTDEEILFFCIHDSDSAGTMIYQTLQQATISRPGRRVKIINLGLDPWEALEMNLGVEKFENHSYRAIADYVRDEYYERLRHFQYTDNVIDYRDWLQNNRVELNSMTTPEFLEWLRKKISQYDNGKVIPSYNVMKKQLIQDTERIMYNKVMEEILKENNFEARLQLELNNIEQDIDKVSYYLEEQVKEDITDTNKHWSTSVNEIAKKIIE